MSGSADFEFEVGEKIVYVRGRFRKCGSVVERGISKSIFGQPYRYYVISCPKWFNGERIAVAPRELSRA